MAYIKCDLDHKVPSIYNTLDIESKNTLDMTYIKGYLFPVQSYNGYTYHTEIYTTISHDLSLKNPGEQP